MYPITNLKSKIISLCSVATVICQIILNCKLYNSYILKKSAYEIGSRISNVSKLRISKSSFKQSNVGFYF